MASNDPTDTGGLFIGRRPGTAPVRYRDPGPSSEGRRREEREDRRDPDAERGEGLDPCPFEGEICGCDRQPEGPKPR